MFIPLNNNVIKTKFNLNWQKLEIFILYMHVVAGLLLAANCLEEEVWFRAEGLERPPEALSDHSWQVFIFASNPWCCSSALPLVETVIPMHTARTQTASHAGVPDGCHVFVMKTEKENVYPSGCVEETQQKPRKTSDWTLSAAIRVEGTLWLAERERERRGQACVQDYVTLFCRNPILSFVYNFSILYSK